MTRRSKSNNGGLNRFLKQGMSLDGRLGFLLNRARERLWVKPLAISLLSILVVFLAGLFEALDPAGALPQISLASIEKLLTVMSSSMLVMAVLAVGAMLSAYNAASNNATPRAFAVVVADDVSQNALSTFIGAFIFSTIALVALLNDYYDRVGRLALFLLTVAVFAVVILSFVRWVDRIARLGRMGETVDKVEAATAQALRRRGRRPTLGAREASGTPQGFPIEAGTVGYVQHIDVAALQLAAEERGLQLRVLVLPGTFVSEGRPLALAQGRSGEALDKGDREACVDAFVIGDERTFDDDPRFGLVVLSEIASRALSPAVNDPGTAIDIIGTLVRLFTLWSEASKEDASVEFDRVEVPALSLDDLFDDAFNAMSRDGASTLEVMIRLQKALRTLFLLPDPAMAAASLSHAQLALRHAEQALRLPEEVEAVRTLTAWAEVAGLQRPGNGRP